LEAAGGVATAACSAFFGSSLEQAAKTLTAATMHRKRIFI
jgi:hypothetical protein